MAAWGGWSQGRLLTKVLDKCVIQGTPEMMVSPSAIYPNTVIPGGTWETGPRLLPPEWLSAILGDSPASHSHNVEHFYLTLLGRYGWPLPSRILQSRETFISVSTLVMAFCLCCGLHDVKLCACCLLVLRIRIQPWGDEGGGEGQGGARPPLCCLPESFSVGLGGNWLMHPFTLLSEFGFM